MKDTPEPLGEGCICVRNERTCWIIKTYIEIILCKVISYIYVVYGE